MKYDEIKMRLVNDLNVLVEAAKLIPIIEAVYTITWDIGKTIKTDVVIITNQSPYYKELIDIRENNKLQLDRVDNLIHDFNSRYPLYLINDAHVLFYCDDAENYSRWKSCYKNELIDRTLIHSQIIYDKLGRLTELKAFIKENQIDEFSFENQMIIEELSALKPKEIKLTRK